MAVEPKRACGYRRIGGIYLEGEKGTGMACGRLPVPIHPCPSCFQVVRFSRSLQRVRPSFILHAGAECADPDCSQLCPFVSVRAHGEAGLLWAGSRYYSPETFTAEARVLGVSRRLPYRPRFVNPGKTWILVAHRGACSERCTCDRLPMPGPPKDAEGIFRPSCASCAGTGRVPVPGVFYLFRVKRIVQIVTDTMAEEECARLRKKGLDLVKVPADDPDHQAGDVAELEDERQARLEL